MKGRTVREGGVHRESKRRRAPWDSQADSKLQHKRSCSTVSPTHPLYTHWLGSDTSRAIRFTVETDEGSEGGRETVKGMGVSAGVEATELQLLLEEADARAAAVASRVATTRMVSVPVRVQRQTRRIRERRRQ